MPTSSFGHGRVRGVRGPERPGASPTHPEADTASVQAKGDLRTMRLLALLLVGCGGTSGSTNTPPDTTDPVVLQDVLDALPPCTRVAGDGLFDLETGCWNGFCLGTDIDLARAELGPCEDESVLSTLAFCDWDSLGISLDYRVEDELIYSIEAYQPSVASTLNGLGPGASLSCFLDAAGPPESIEFEPIDDVWWPTRLRWEQLDLTVTDDSSAGGSNDPDGLADDMDISD